MIRHNLLLIFRNFKRNKNSFLINLIGLSTGLACVLMIYLWVSDELSIDKFHEKNKQLYQVMANFHHSNNILTQEATPDLLAESLAKEIPEIEYAVAVAPGTWMGKIILSYDEKSIKPKGQYAGKNFFNIFSYKLIQGNKNTVLSDKNSVVISEDLAEKLFGRHDNIIGKTIELKKSGVEWPVVVSGIFKNVPSNSSSQFDFVLTFEAFKDLNKKAGRSLNWDNFGPRTYLILKKGTNPEQFNNKIKDYIKSKYEFSIVTLFITPFSDKYLYGKYENGKQAGGRIEYVNLFLVIALLILIIACVNFMNLSTAEASSRTKEVGIKKAVGASRKNLVFQYLSESVFMAFLSLFIAIILVVILLPQFNQITGKDLAFNYNQGFILSILAITLFTGLISGSYPALYLSGFNPVLVLKGKINKSVGELFARKGLVILQFALSTILIVSVLVVHNQIDFVQSKNLGYNKDNIIYFEKEGSIVKNENAFISELKKIPGVINASSSGSIIVGSNSSTEGVKWEGKKPEDVIRFEYVPVNYDMIETFGMKIMDGRSYSTDFGSEDSKILFNETAIKAMGLTNPVGKTVNFWGKEKQIIGVIKDFHYESLHERVKPLLFHLNTNHTLKIIARIQSGKERDTISRIKKLYADFNPGIPFNYRFLDHDFRILYEAEKRVSRLSMYFAGLAIIISCLGLFGLAAFTAERRRKEIGVRKVLGSGALRIVVLLSGDFTKIVLTSMLIAFPVSYFITKNWLEDFAYRIDLQVWYFIGAGFITLFIAWITVGTQAIKAALANPVESLRYE